MSYHFDFSWLADYWPLILQGVGTTIILTVVGAVFGVSLGIACAYARMSRLAWLRVIVATYVELIRNTPFLIQLFFLFFGLPSLGIQIGEFQASALAMVINLGAYSCEIVRAGLQATPKGQFEAGASLAMTRFETFWYVVLVPSLQRIWPSLTSQIVIVMLGSAVVSQIATQDLTFAANFIQSRNFRAFECYFIATAIYLGLALILRQVMRGIGGLTFPRRAAK